MFPKHQILITVISKNMVINEDNLNLSKRIVIHFNFLTYWRVTDKQKGTYVISVQLSEFSQTELMHLTSILSKK